MVCHSSTWLCGRAPMTTSAASVKASSFKLKTILRKFNVSSCTTFYVDSACSLSVRGGSSVKKTSVDQSPKIIRRWIQADHLTSPSQERFTVVSYNILADRNATKHKDMYTNIPYSYINWESRKRVICDELIGWNSDIVCLQEVDKYYDLLRILEKAGYIGSYKRRTGNTSDGCAIFWKPNKLRLLEEENIEFKEFGLRDNVAQLSVFEMCNAQSRRILIGNIHVLYYPTRGDVKLGQSRFLSSRAHNLSKKWDNAPIVLAGDFNFTPQSAIYKFLSTSELDIMSYDRREMSGQKSCEPSQVLAVKKDTWIPFTLIDRFSRNCWTNEELKVATGNTKGKVVVHPLKLNSSYAALKGSEPLATSYHSKFLGTVDYLWYSDGIIPTKVLDTVSLNVLQRIGGLPCEKIGSDHLALVSEYAFTQGTERNNKSDEIIALEDPTFEDIENQLN